MQVGLVGSRFSSFSFVSYLFYHSVVNLSFPLFLLLSYFEQF